MLMGTVSSQVAGYTALVGLRQKFTTGAVVVIAM
jgi:hypothetical protein